MDDLAVTPQPKATDVAVYFDPATHHQFGNKLFDRESNPYAGDNILAPYAAVFDRLTAAGLPVKTADLLPREPDGKRNVLISFGTPDAMSSTRAPSEVHGTTAKLPRTAARSARARARDTVACGVCRRVPCRS